MAAGNGATMVLAFKEAKRFDADFKPWAVNVVESDEAYERD